ncbi:hypothetical protein BWZ22_13505 [Seonamhaeicola sp. S2-3]|uniref:hypothetical protein n=1 Tax=Seonamhaeicola sp. S2-3 TaxID=1936081 RepID=UPI000972C50B|nr:hypothetical protein [Seonamhaeicola sp. S2-3]APY12178.1 hypothetical protein BWZ22_13505 [Seonamhaeicola sp. S2-3]
MNYSKSKAEKLVTEFDYLKSKPYFPYGKEGKEFKITSLETINKLGAERYAKSDSKKQYKEPIKENYHVLVVISDGETEIRKDLVDVLSRLKIQHDIDNVPN